MKKAKLTLLCLIQLTTLKAQLLDQDLDLQLFIEDVFQLQEEDVDYEGLYESLLILYTDPINLNKANGDDLRSLYLLTDLQIDDLISYIDRNGELISIYELQAVPGFDAQTIRRIIPFVTVDDKVSDTRSLLQRILEAENKFLITRFQRTFEIQRGFTEPDTSTNGDLSSRFQGDRNSLYSRFRVSRSKDFSIGLTLEKDAGESFRFSRNSKVYGFDFSSFHFLLENKKRWKSVVLGDYQLQFGQGLLLGAGFNPGKGSETIVTVRRSDLGIRPYSSILESGFFRGAASTYNLGRFDITAFYSDQRQDANIRNDSTFTDFDEFISSIQSSGFHRTSAERESQNRIREQVVGSNITYRTRRENFRVGLTAVHSEFSLPIFRRPNAYNQFEFQGDQNNNYGIHASYRWQNLNFFGETAISRSGGMGSIAGLIASLSRDISFSLLLRNYQRDFHSFYGNAFGESSRNINESGVYWGIKYRPIRTLSFTAYYDRFRFPWLRFRAEAPSQGYEYLMRLRYHPTRNFSLYAQFREESKDQNSATEQNLQLLSTAVKRNYLINLDYQPNEIISLKSRVQWSDFRFESKKTNGFAIIQDFNFSFGKFRLGTRFALFDTDDFENRQFAYEKDVLYAFSIPAYNGVGIRNYLLIRYNLSEKITFWGKLSRTFRSDVTSIGSGLSEIEANHRTDLRLQARYKF